MSQPIVAVPSYGRAGKVTTCDVFPSGLIVVKESQADTYRALQHLPDGWDIYPIPDDEDGNISKARNAILKHFAGEDVVMLDDDYRYMARIEGGQSHRMDHRQIRHMLEQGFILCRDLGTVLWGVNVQADPRFYREYSPFSTVAIIVGTFMGFTSDRPDDLLFDEDLWLKEDYDMSLRVLHRYHRILKWSSRHYMVDHITGEGGLKGRRPMDEEVRQAHRLQKRWGSAVVKLEHHRSTNPKVKVPLKGI